MDINLDQIIASIVPWQLAVVVGGRRLAVKPATLGQMAAIAGETDLTRLQKLVESLFETPPDTRDWTQDQVMALVQVIAAYAAGRSKKNAAPMGKAIAAAMS